MNDGFRFQEPMVSIPLHTECARHGRGVRALARVHAGGPPVPLQVRHVARLLCGFSVLGDRAPCFKDFRFGGKIADTTNPMIIAASMAYVLHMDII